MTIAVLVSRIHIRDALVERATMLFRHTQGFECLRSRVTVQLCIRVPVFTNLKCSCAFKDLFRELDLRTEVRIEIIFFLNTGYSLEIWQKMTHVISTC